MNLACSLSSEDDKALAQQLQRARFDYDRRPTDKTYIHLLEVERMVRTRTMRAQQSEIFALRRRLSDRSRTAVR